MSESELEIVVDDPTAPEADSPAVTSNRTVEIVVSLALLAPEALGYAVTAFVRLRYPLGNYKPLHDLLDSTPEIIEAHHVTGDYCFVLKVLARSMTDLEQLAGRIAGLGSITTSVVYSSPLPRRALVPPG